MHSQQEPHNIAGLELVLDFVSTVAEFNKATLSGQAAIQFKRFYSERLQAARELCATEESRLYLGSFFRSLLQKAERHASFAPRAAGRGRAPSMSAPNEVGLQSTLSPVLSERIELVLSSFFLFRKYVLRLLGVTLPPMNPKFLLNSCKNDYDLSTLIEEGLTGIECLEIRPDDLRALY